MLERTRITKACLQAFSRTFSGRKIGILFTVSRKRDEEGAERSYKATKPLFSSTTLKSGQRKIKEKGKAEALLFSFLLSFVLNALDKEPLFLNPVLMHTQI